MPDIIHINASVYAVVYRGADVDGWIKTIGVETVVVGGAQHLMIMGVG